MKKIFFLNWWSNGRGDFFHNFVKKYIDRDITFCSKNPDIVFISVFGPREKAIDYLKNKKCVSIFFTGESTSHPNHKKYEDHLLEYVDIALGFKYLDNPKYLRFPLWMTYIDIPDLKIGKSCLGLDKLSNFKRPKDKFCCILSNHDNFGTRTLIFDKVNCYKKIDSAGNFKRNIGGGRRPIPNGENHKQNWLSQYKFNICCESLIEEGYITEKVFECLLAGCVPIYLVNNMNDKIEEKILNQEVILKFTKENVDEVVEKIKLLDNDNNLYLEFKNKNVINEGGIEYVKEKYEELKNKIIVHLK